MTAEHDPSQAHRTKGLCTLEIQSLLARFPSLIESLVPIVAATLQASREFDSSHSFPLLHSNCPRQTWGSTPPSEGDDTSTEILLHHPLSQKVTRIQEAKILKQNDREEKWKTNLA
eukprot:TRINITY_DN312_c0_g2_i1.p1 TRINITY_DN312_c0_g2~~TRINITY_DN312_c0_g2_i1.p1  ORF type:complete len:116 (+),score=22.33 TRINITY_DN312_c0_g2_i1:298-645(+)